jgi:nucleoside-diphosphate-sugar epimerase
MVLVTGATGWLGTNLIHKLRGDQMVTAIPVHQDVHIRCLVPEGENVDSLQRLDGVEVVRGAIADAGSVGRWCEGARDAVVFHAAGVIHPKSVKDFYTVNHLGTVRVLEAAARHGVKRVVGVSSNAPFGFNPASEHVFTEQSPYHPYLNYGRSKMLMEQAMLAASAERRVETVVVRPPWYYGAYQPDRQTLFYRMIRAGRVPMFGGGRSRRSMAYVGNVVQGMLRAASVEKADGRAFWIADSRPYPMYEVVGTIARVLEEFGYPCAKHQTSVPSAVAALARVADAALQKAGLYNSKVHVLGEMSRTIACAVDTARSELGYEPEVNLEEGVRRSLHWCAEHGIRI